MMEASSLSSSSAGHTAVSRTPPQVVVGKPVSSVSPAAVLSSSSREKPTRGNNRPDLSAVAGKDRTFSDWTVATGVSVEQPNESDDFDDRGRPIEDRGDLSGGGGVYDFSSSSQQKTKSPASLLKDVRLSSRLIFYYFLFGSIAILYGYEQSASRMLLDPVVEYFHVCDHQQTNHICLSKLLFFFLSPLGSVIGCFAGGFIAHAWGPRNLFYIVSVLFVTGFILYSSASYFAVLLASRAVIGAAQGAGFVSSSMYLSEILPKDSRGTFLSSFFLLQLFGSLTARALLPADSIQAAKVAQHLAYVGGLGAVAVGALFLVLLVLVPESPRWLLQRQRKARALRALEMLGESSMEAGAIVVQQSEIYLPHRLLVRGGGATQAADGEGLCTRLFSSHGLDFAGVLACVLAAVFVGGESIFFFSGDLIGAVICDNRLSLLAVSIAKVLGGISCILVVDSWGRRPLLCFGTSVAATGYFFLMMGYLWGGAGSPVSRFGFPSSSSTIAPSQACSFIPGDEGGSGLLYFFPTVFYFLGLLFVVFGLSSSWIPLLYLLVCELIPTCVRGVAVGMCLSLFFFLKATSLLLLGSTLFQSYAGAGSTFGVYGLLSLLVVCYIYFCIPEAAGLSIEESAPDGSGPSAWLSIVVRQRSRFLQMWGRGRKKKVAVHDENEEGERQMNSRDVQALVEEGRLSPSLSPSSPTTSKQEEEETRGGGRTRGAKAVGGGVGGGGESILQEIELQQQSFGA